MTRTKRTTHEVTFFEKRNRGDDVDYRVQADFATANALYDCLRVSRSVSRVEIHKIERAEG